MKQGREQFLSESTPVVDMKKAAGRADVNWDNEKTEVYLEDEGAGGSAYLIDAAGEFNPITAFPFVIGRGNECDLVVSGKGISRKHVEIVFQSGRFVVNDLDSLNGMKVNGYKVARVILEEGDEIRLGEVALTFSTTKNESGRSAGNTSKSSSHESGKSDAVLSKKGGGVPRSTVLSRILIGVSAIAIVGAGGVYWQSHGNSTIGAVVSMTPSPAQVPENTASSKPEAVPAVQTTPNGASSSATGPTTAQNSPALTPETAQPSMLQDMSVSGVEPPPPPVSISVPPPNPGSIVASIKPTQKSQKAESPRTNAKEQTRNSVSPEKPIVASKTTSVAVAIPENRVEVDKSVVVSQFDARYLKGEAEGALKDLKGIASNLSVSPQKRAEAESRYAAISAIFNEYNEGSKAFASGDKERAFVLWSKFLADEKRVFGGKKSIYTSMAASKVIDDFVAKGNAAALAGDHHVAYAQWQKALQIGDSVAARIAVDGVDQKAKQLYRQALRLEYVNTTKARELWQQVVDLVPPGSEYYTKASSKIAWYDKWGG